MVEQQKVCAFLRPECYCDRLLMHLYAQAHGHTVMTVVIWEHFPTRHTMVLQQRLPRVVVMVAP